MKTQNLFRRIIKSRFVWFVIGICIWPGIKMILPLWKGASPKEAMGNVAFYEENKSLYTFLGDHSYSLKFPGDRNDFKRYAIIMELDEYKIDDNLYQIRDEGEGWERKLSFHKDENLKNIQYVSHSW